MGPGSGRPVRDGTRAPRGWWRLGVAAALVAGAVAGLAAPASAHATLESTDPATGTSVSASPGTVVLHFDEQVSVSPASIEVFNASAKRVDSGTTRHVPNDSRAVETAIPTSLPAGGYVVTWRVVSADSHPVNGAFTFFIGTAANGSAITAEASSLLARTSGSRTVGVLYGIARFLGFLTVAMLLGGALFVAHIWPQAREDRRARLVVWSSLVAVALVTVIGFGLEGVYGAGLGISQITRSSVLSAVWHTRFGKAYAARLVLLALIGALLGRILGRGRRSRSTPLWWSAAAGAGAAALLATWGLADHASTGSLVALAVPFDVIHLGAAAIWIGGLVMIVAAVIPASRGERAGPDSPLRVAVPRFSDWALGSVVAIVATGVFAAWREVSVSWGALTTTPYGKLLLYKSGGLLALVALATVSRTTIHGSLNLPGAHGSTGRRRATSRTGQPLTEDGVSARLRAVVGAEVVVGVAVLALTAVLVGARPAKDAYAAPFSTEVKAGPTLVNLVVDPAKAGPLALHLYVLTPDGQLDDVPEVDASMSNPRAGISGLTVPLHPAGPGHYVAYGFDVPIQGTWTIRVTVRTDALNEYFAAPISVHIR